MKLTRPHASRLSVFGFQTRDTRPEPNPLSFRRSITIFRPDPARSHRYLTKSRRDLDRSDQISARSLQVWADFVRISMDSAIFRPDLVGSGQISSLVRNPKLTRRDSKLTRFEPKNPTTSPGQFRVTFSSTQIIRVGSRLGTNPTRPDPWTPLTLIVPKPNCKDSTLLISSTDSPEHDVSALFKKQHNL